MKKTIQTIVVATLCLNFSSKAQEPIKPPLSKNQAIIGKVISASTREVLPGAVIKVTNTNQTILSNNKGEFIINLANGNYNLAVHYLSYKAKTISIQIPLKEQLVIELDTDDQNLKEVEINAGYYTVKDRERTGSISRVTAETIGKQPVVNPLEALQGTMPGIYIQQTSGVPGSNVNVQIRGQNSISAGNDPLYIIDGVPFGAQSLSSRLSSELVFGLKGSSPLNSFSANDIESVEILKDADATAIYGSRGANGIILITTKKGKSGKTTFSIDVNGGGSKVPMMMKMMNTPQYLEMRKEAFANDGIKPKATDYDVNGIWDMNRFTDWQNTLIGGTAGFTNTQFSLSGGNDQTQVLLAGSHLKQGTVFPGDLNYTRYSGHLSVNQKAFDNKLNAQVSVMYSGDNNRLFNGDLTAISLYLAPNAPALYTADGKLNWENSTWINPVKELETRFRAKGNTFVANAVLSYKLLKNLTIKANLGYNSNRLNDNNVTPSSYYNPADQSGSNIALLDLTHTAVQSWIAEPQIDWYVNTRFGKLSMLAGMTFQHQEKEQTSIRGTGFSSDALVENILAAAKTEIRDYNNPLYRYQAVYGRINFSLLGKYIFNLTGRRDGSSRFGPARHFANFGAAGFAWLWSEGDFVKKHFPFVSSGKFSTSYGVTGNDQIGDYGYLDVYEPYSTYNGISTLNPSRLLNPDFGWELNKKFEIGLDLGLFTDRIRLNTMYYHNRSSNQLISYPLAATTGFKSITSNLAATVQNSGFEVDITSLNVESKKWNWTSSFNITIPENKLIAFPGLSNSSYASDYVIGKSLKVRRVYHSLGVNAQTGLWEVEDQSGDGKITTAADRNTVVEPGQQFYGGLNNTLSYGSFQLSFLLQFVKQREAIFAKTYATHPGLSNQPAIVLENRWTKAGDNASLQRYTTGNISAAKTAYTRYLGSDAAYGDASFVRLKNIHLAYQFKKTDKWPGLRIYLQAQNLLTFSNYTGLDPESASIKLPPLKTVTAGLQLIL
jgi:TonB-linked SusC/RagA family outer membrane protein